MLAFFSWIVAILLSNGVDYEMAKLVSDDPFVVKDFIEDNFVKFVCPLNLPSIFKCISNIFLKKL